MKFRKYFSLLGKAFMKGALGLTPPVVFFFQCFVFYTDKEIDTSLYGHL